MKKLNTQLQMKTTEVFDQICSIWEKKKKTVKPVGVSLLSSQKQSNLLILQRAQFQISSPGMILKKEALA